MSHAAKPSRLLDTRVIYCGDNLEQLKKLPEHSIDLIYIDPPFNSNRNYEVFWGETKEKRSFEDRHESTQAYIEFMRPRCVELAIFSQRPEPSAPLCSVQLQAGGPTQAGC
jgi:16S rRNA G966 N2-methylase RsmD